MAYIHILCVKRKLFSSKKENRLQHHYRLGSQQVQFLPKTEAASPLFFLLPLVPCVSSPVTRVSRSPLLAITMKKLNSLNMGGEGGRERVWSQVFSPCVPGMDWNMILVLFSLQSSSRARKVKTTVGSVKFVWSILYSLICVLVSLLYLIS